MHEEEPNMTCSYSMQVIEETIAFHGHNCPGLAIGIRAAEYAQKLFPETSPPNLVCVTETDMCGVDAIQYLTGCTYGKGNFLHRDYGKTAFSFYDRSTNNGIRLVLKPESRGKHYHELAALMLKRSDTPLTPEESEKLSELRAGMEERIMSQELPDLFAVEQLQTTPPRPTRILQSLCCEECGEETMESRTRRFGGKTLCIPCYLKVEQKI